MNNKPLVNDTIKSYDPCVKSIVIKNNYENEVLESYEQTKRNEKEARHTLHPFYNSIDDIMENEFGEWYLENEFYNYEITITFNEVMHSPSSMHNHKRIAQVVGAMLYNHHNISIDSMWMCKEYFKKLNKWGTYTPHYHIFIKSNEEMDEIVRSSLITKTNVMFGRTTFRPVEKPEQYKHYIVKDVIDNQEKYKYSHLYQF